MNLIIYPKKKSTLNMMKSVQGWFIKAVSVQSKHILTLVHSSSNSLSCWQCSSLDSLLSAIWTSLTMVLFKLSYNLFTDSIKSLEVKYNISLEIRTQQFHSHHWSEPCSQVRSINQRNVLYTQLEVHVLTHPEWCEMLLYKQFISSQNNAN